MDRYRALPLLQCGLHQAIDFFHGRISHGKAAPGRTAAMDHDLRPLTTMDGIVKVWIANVKGKVITGVRIELIEPDLVESFRTLLVSFGQFWTEKSGIATDGVALEKPEASPGLDPQFQPFRELEDPEVDLAAHGQFLTFQLLFKPGQGPGERLCSGGGGRDALCREDLLPWNGCAKQPCPEDNNRHPVAHSLSRAIRALSPSGSGRMLMPRIHSSPDPVLPASPHPVLPGWH